MSFLTRNGLQYWSESAGSSTEAVARQQSVRRELVGKSYERPADRPLLSWSPWKHLRALHVLHVLRRPAHSDLASIVIVLVHC